MACLREQKEKRNPRKHHLLCTDETLLKETTFSSPDSFRPSCPGPQEFKPPTFIGLLLVVISQVVRSQPLPLWSSAGTVCGVRSVHWRASSPEQWPLLVACHPHPVDSTFRVEKTENISAHGLRQVFSLSGLQLPELRKEGDRAR